MQNVPHYVQFHFLFLPLLFCVAFLSQENVLMIGDLVAEEVEDKNTHRGQKAIYLYQL